MGNKKYQTDKEAKSAAPNRNKYIAFSLIAIVGVCSLFIYGVKTDWKFTANAAGIDDTPVTNTTTTPTNIMTFKFLEKNGSLLDGREGRGTAHGYLYSYYVSDPANFDDSDFNKLTPSDFSLAATLVDGQSFTRQANTYYYLIGNCSGYGDNSLMPLDGTNNVTLVKTPTNSSIIAFSNKGDTSVNETNDCFWDVILNFANVDGQIDANVGYKPYLEYRNMTRLELADAAIVYNVITLTFNTTITTLDVIVSGMTYSSIVADSNVLKIYINSELTGQNSLSFELDSDDLGSVYEINSMAFCRGMLGGSLTTIASC